METPIQKLNYFDLPRFFAELEKYYRERYDPKFKWRTDRNKDVGTCYTVWDAIEEYNLPLAGIIPDVTPQHQLTKEDYKVFVAPAWVDEVMNRVDAMHQHYKQLNVQKL